MINSTGLRNSIAIAMSLGGLLVVELAAAPPTTAAALCNSTYAVPGSAVRTVTPASADAKPGQVRHLAIGLVCGGPNRFVTWTAPASGGTPTSYVIRVQYVPNNRNVFARTVPASQTYVYIPQKTLLANTFRPRGDVRALLRYRLIVRAANADGAGPIAVKYFFVRT